MAVLLQFRGGQAPPGVGCPSGCGRFCDGWIEPERRKKEKKKMARDGKAVGVFWRERRTGCLLGQYLFFSFFSFCGFILFLVVFLTSSCLVYFSSHSFHLYFPVFFFFFQVSYFFLLSFHFPFLFVILSPSSSSPPIPENAILDTHSHPSSKDTKNTKSIN